MTTDATSVELDLETQSEQPTDLDHDEQPEPAESAPPEPASIEPVALDDQCASAIEAARTALIEDVGETQVGQYLEARAEAERVVTHLFECTNKAYVGWHWAVTVTRADGFDDVTVDELVLLPGPHSILAPAWVPWEERLKAGDLGVGDVLPTPADDIRLTEGYTGADDDTALDDDLHPALWELGLGRARVMSQDGRLETANRWVEGKTGPKSKMAREADNQCSTCGFMLPMAGPLGTAFGVCGNEFAPTDAHVVALDYGCGGHSEVKLEQAVVPVVPLAIDDLTDDLDSHPLTAQEEIAIAEDLAFARENQLTEAEATAKATALAELQERASHD